MSTRVEQLLQAGNEASARVRNLWITFLLFGTYLAIAIGGTTHRQMLLESPIVLPILGAELPLVDFYRIAPGLFLVFHFYMLVQLYLLAEKLRVFDAALRYPFVLKDAQKDLRTRTDNFLITQLLVGRQPVLLVRIFIWLAAWLTMVVAPVVLLLAFQIRFLPYHDVTTTWIQRGFLIVNLLLIWLLWPAIASREGGLGGAVVALFWKPWVGLYRTLYRTAKSAAASYRSGDFRTYLKVGFAGYVPFRRTWNQFLYNLFWAILTIVASVAVIGFSVLVATIPAEGIERWLLASWEPLRQRALDDEAMRRCLDFDAEAGWQDNWWLPGLIRQDEEQASGCTYLLTGIGGSYLAVEPWFSKRPRDRSVPGDDEPNAVWWPTYLLFEGEADDVSSKTSSLFSRNLVLIDDFDLVTLDDEALKKADGTLVLRGRDLRYARFDRSDLRKADLLKAKLTGAVMWGTRLDNANLHLARMQGADLRGAGMQGANLFRAGMQGANLSGAEMQGANLFRARMQGADLSGAEMQGADLSFTRMQGTDLSGARLWMAVADATYLEWADTRATNDEDPFADSDLLKRKKVIDAWLDAIPEGSARDLASDRLDILRDPSRGPAECRPWLCAQIPPPKDWNDATETGLGNYLGELGCKADTAPHVPQGLLRRMDSERSSFRGQGEPRGFHPILAAALLAPDCAGAKGLTKDERARLRAIADAKQ